MSGPKRLKDRRSRPPRSTPPPLRDLLELVETVARELSSLLEVGEIPRDRRPEARRRVMEAWMALNANGSARRRMNHDIEALRVLIGTMDRLAHPIGHDFAVIPRLLHVSERPTLISLDTDHSAAEQGVVARIQALERATLAIQRRTETMIEHALKALEQGRAGPDKTGISVREGREDLELVWGETEG